MASAPQTNSGISLEQFLRDPRIDEHPYLEYVDGQVEAKVSPQKKHAEIQYGLVHQFNVFAAARGLGRAYVELRCTFDGRSILPDVVFLLDEHIEGDERGEPTDETRRAPDIHVEVISPEQRIPAAQRKLVHSTAHGCQLGVLIDPEQRMIEIYRPGQTALRLADSGAIDFAPVLPGLLLPVSEVFGWLVYRRPKPRAERA